MYYINSNLWHRFWLIGHKATFKPNSRPTPTNADQFSWPGQVWLGKNYPLWLKSVVIPDQHPLYPLYFWCTNAQIPFFPTYPRPSGWLIPALHDQHPTYSWYNYAQYAQYRTNPRSICLISIPGLKWIIQANVEKKEEIWLSPMTKAHTPTEMSKGQSDNINNATKKFDYTAVADRLRTVSWSNHSHPTGVVNRFTGPPSH